MSRWIRVAFAAFTLALLAAPATAAVHWVAEDSATLRWDPADGPVEAYGVWIRRNGGAFGDRPDMWVSEPEATIYAMGFEQVAVRIAAFDMAGHRGPLSAISDPILFVPPPEEPEDANPAKPFDLDGDGATELLWHSPDQDQLLLMQLAADLSPSGFILYQLEPGEKVIGSGDFDADGHADILLRGSDPSDRRIWFMDGLELREEKALPRMLVLGAVEALGDFDADGRTDLLWRLPPAQGGKPLITFLEGAAVAGLGLLPESPLPFRAAPDLDGDGDADLFLHDAPAGASEAWLLDGDGVSAAALGPPPWPRAELVGTSDIDGDGDDDLLWQNPGSGGLRLWFMDGFDAVEVRAWTYADTQYVHALGDYDGDGRADDALIRDAVTGSTWIGRFSWDGVSAAAPPARTAIESPGPEWLPVAN